MNYPIRYIARFILQAVTPVAVGSGERSAITDRLILRDVNDLPFIPGTSLAGVLRNSLLGILDIDDVFGFQQGKEGAGSRLVVSEARMVGSKGHVMDGLVNIDYTSEFYSKFKQLPVRQHVRITPWGVADDGGKFDEEVVYTGTRFCFELELISASATIASDKASWESILSAFSDPAFRIGAGTRKGFGAFRIVSKQESMLDLRDTQGKEQYLIKTASLNDPYWNSIKVEKPKAITATDNWAHYQVIIRPEDFFLFSSGFGSETADMTWVKEQEIVWENGVPQFSDDRILVPATSIKGALAHRIAYHYNKLKEVYADELDQPGFIGSVLRKGYTLPDDGKGFDSKKPSDRQKLLGESNPAVRKLFGYAAHDKDGQRGNVLLSDILIEAPGNSKLLNHIMVDRFTSGVIQGALFSEEVVGDNDLDIKLDLYVNRELLQDHDTKSAFEAALEDLCAGRLPLGGGTMRGHGSFTGTFTTNMEDVTNE